MYKDYYVIHTNIHTCYNVYICLVIPVPFSRVSVQILRIDRNPDELSQLRRFFTRILKKSPSLRYADEHVVRVPPETMNLRVSGVDNGRCGTPL